MAHELKVAGMVNCFKCGVASIHTWQPSAKKHAVNALHEMQPVSRGSYVVSKETGTI